MIKRPTIADVAQAAGVSPQTVSRAINDKGEISAETKERIMEIARQLSFRPSNIARSLVKQQTTTIGIVIPDITNPFFSEIVRGVEDLAHLHSYNVFLCNTDEVPERELSSIDSLLEKQVDGVILCSSRLEEGELASKLKEFPFAVLINREIEEIPEKVRIISFDDRLGMCMAVNHLIQRGHKHIAFLAGPERSRSGQKRLSGYYSCLKENGISIDPGLVHFCEPSFEGGLNTFHKLLDAHPEVTAVLCYNDLVAIGAIREILTRNLSIPADLSVIGFDDIPMAALVHPPLTTLRMPKREVGVIAMKILIDLLEGNNPAEYHKVFLPELIIRGSTN